MTELRQLLTALERDGTTVMELACGGRDVTPWTLYPDDYGVFDRDTGCQSYFHRHDGATHEAGHFHTVRLFPDHTVHLVAISMARDGWPQALFTLNLWAIGDRYESGAALKRYARRFRIDETRGDARLVRFVNLVFQAFTPQIERLQEGKITRLAEHRLANPGVDPFNDRSLEILSRLAIDVRARPTHSMREVQA